ncbi:MAG: hypothetical protein ABJZ69_03345 [Hyphomicrobiales bacterium]
MFPFSIYQKNRKTGLKARWFAPGALLLQMIESADDSSHLRSGQNAN